VNVNGQDVGPYRIDLVVAIWYRIARVTDALYAIGALAVTASTLRQIVDVCKEQGNEAIDDPDLTRALRILAAQDGMHAGDWLRARAVEAQMPRRKPPAPLDLQIRLKGVQCMRLVAQLITRREGETVTEAHRVTIRNTRGDVASCESASFANALEGAIKMAGARGDQP
jgi:hypothetical protein